MKENILKKKSFEFALRVVKMYKCLQDEKKKFIMSKQLMRSRTSTGAIVRETEFAESKNDFAHKMAIAQKEINETLYWLELLQASEYLTIQEFDSINTDAVEIIKLITASIKTAKGIKH
ncbi:MAG: four helix bundle protein [Prevotella sp.]|jgi:four helix bundle protein|nr:four helix bundle protein [Prevotella sp.]